LWDIVFGIEARWLVDLFSCGWRPRRNLLKGWSILVAFVGAVVFIW